MDVDLEKEIKTTRYKLIQFIVLFLAVGSGLTLLNSGLGIVVFALCIMFLLLPFILELVRMLGAKI